MRDILFRGKSVDNGKWYEGSSISDCEHGSNRDKVVAIKETTTQINTYSCDLIPIIVDPKTVSQYTGRKDKNGEMTFEGDKLKIKTFISQECGKDKLLEFDDKFIVWSGEYLQYVLLNKKEIEQLKNGSNHFKYSGHGDFDNVYYLCDLDSYEIEIIGNIHD